MEKKDIEKNIQSQSEEEELNQNLDSGLFQDEEDDDKESKIFLKNY